MSDRIGTAPPSPTGPRTWRRLLPLAAMLLAAALGGGLMAWQARQAQAAVGVPSRLAPLPDGAVWLVMDQAMWRLDRQGAVTARSSAAQAGLPALPVLWALLDHAATSTEDASMDELTPEGEPMPHARLSTLIALAHQPDQAYVLDAGTGRLQSRIALQWPVDLRNAADQPSGLAVHQDGRMAIALGKVGVVAVFGPQGELLARSAPGTFAPHEANSDALPGARIQGLWWDGDELWSTDGPRHALIRFKGDDLAVKARVALTQDNPSEARWTTAAVPHPQAGTVAVAPLATLIRQKSHQAEGRVTHVWPDGMEKDENLGPDARPLDIAWVGDALLVAEGRDLRLRRFDIDRQPLSDLGDATVRQTLQHLREERDEWIHRMLAWLGAALGAAIAGLGVLAWGLSSRPQARQQAVSDEPAPLEASASAAAAVEAPVQAAVAVPGELSALSQSPDAAPELMAVTSPSVDTPPRPRDVAWDRALGQAFHQARAWDAVRQDTNERLREHFEMAQGQTRRWVLLTNRRLLSFKPADHGEGWHPDKDWHRSDLATIEQWLRRRMSWQQRWKAPKGDGAWLRLKSRDGQTLEGFVRPLDTAERVHAVVSLTARPPAAG